MIESVNEKYAAIGVCPHGNFLGKCPACAKETAAPGRRELLDIVETRDHERTTAALENAASGWLRLERRDGPAALEESMDWYESNNHRINIYDAIGSDSEEWSHEDKTGRHSEHLLALKKLEICLKQLAVSERPHESAQKLAEFAISSFPAHVRETAIDSLSRLGPAGASGIEAIMADAEAPARSRLRAATSGLRFGTASAAFKGQCESLLGGMTSLSGYQELSSAIELAGLVGGEAGRAALAAIQEVAIDLPQEQRRFIERDIYSTRLAVEPDSKEKIVHDLGGRAFDVDGILFGSLAETTDFADFIGKNQDKLKAVAVALKRTNEAFGAEPILFVDIIPDSMAAQANEGWTQNSIHLSRSLLEHPRISIKTSTQGAIHEACERWESKGFVDAEMERDYLQLMGDKYAGSQLDKFRLKNRFDTPNARAGHPWDGTREYVAEAGSVLLAEPEIGARWLGGSEGKECGQALEHVQNKIRQHADRMAQATHQA